MAVSQTLTLTEISGSQSISANTSKVRILWTSTQSGQSHNHNTRTAYYYISVDGSEETQYSVSYTLPYQSTKTILDTTITVGHNSSGGGILTVRTWMDTQISAGEVEKTASLELSQIERKAYITSATDFTDESNPSFTYSVPDPGSIQSLKVIISHDGQSADVSHRAIPIESGSYSLTLTEGEFTTLRKLTTDGPSRIVRIELRSQMSDGTVLWSVYPVTFTVLEREDTVPEITECILSPVNSGLGAKFDTVYIQNKSMLHIDAKAIGKYGASITECRCTIRGFRTYSMELDGTSATLTTDVLKVSGTNLQAIIDVKDSRGFSSTATFKFTVHRYSDPLIVSITGDGSVQAYRSDANGNPQEDSTSVWVKAEKSYTAISENGEILNFATLKARIRYADNENSWGSYITLSDGKGADSFSGTLAYLADIDKSYVLQLRIEDLIGTPYAIDIPVPTANADMHLGGNCIGIGQYADRTKQKTIQIARDWSILHDGKNIGLIMHPVGSLLISAEGETSPGEIAGGTWENIGSISIGSETLYCWKRTE